MAQQFNNDRQLLAALTLEEDLDIIQGLDDEPNDVGGLTAAELKAKFDEAGQIIQRHINEKMAHTLVEKFGEVERSIEAETLRGEQGPAGPQGPKGAGTNENLLDNWYFADPINQRGKTSYEAGTYTVDRWVRSGYGPVTVGPQGVSMRLTNEAGWLSFAQVLEKERVRPGKRHTFSVLGKGRFKIMYYVGGVYYAGAEYNSDTLGLVASTWDLPESVFPNGVTQLEVVVSAQDLEEVVLVAAKLELGEEQTLAHQDANGSWVLNDPPPNQALELAKCQRYYVQISDAGAKRGIVLALLYYKMADLYIPLPVKMRATPSVAARGGFEAYGSGYNGETINLSNARGGTLCENGIRFLVTTDEQPTAESPIVLMEVWDSECLIEISADL